MAVPSDQGPENLGSPIVDGRIVKGRNFSL
jgi:hypothetical protein